MGNPWMNYKKMQEITSTQKNCIGSSKVHIKSMSYEKDSRQIYIIHSSGVQIKFINRCVKWKDIEDAANEDKSGQLSQNDH